MIRISSRDFWEEEADIRINTCNCVGVMGKGIALEFKNRYPEMFADYKKACEGGLAPGTLHVWHGSGAWVVNFPTKKHWRDRSEYEYINDGLAMLYTYLKGVSDTKCIMGDWKLTPIKVAIPARVSRMIHERLEGLCADIILFPPKEDGCPNWIFER